MLTKITLTIDGDERELGPDCVKNWDDVMCTYKRSDFSGVVRQFTSKFEFVNDAYDMLLEAYLANQLMADVKVAIYLIDNNWNYHKHFECPLDFSSVQIENRVFSVSAVDNSAAALIKANKGTKYEFNVGSEIEPDSTFHFDRLPMTESVTYAFSNGSTDEQTGALNVTHPTNQSTIWMGNIASEICINQTIFWNDDQTEEEDSFVLKAVKEVDVRLDYSVLVDRLGSFGDGIICLMVQHLNRYGTVATTQELGWFGGDSLSDKYLGEFNRESELPTLINTYGEDNIGKFATIKGEVYEAQYRGISALMWVNTHKTKYEFSQKKTSGFCDFHLSDGDKLRFRVRSTNNNNTARFRVVQSTFQFSWKARGEVCDIPAFNPSTVLDKILQRISDGKVNLVGEISTADSRLQGTYLLAAESVRGIDGAKFYSSFTDFCNWMEAVFGYTYYIGESLPSQFTDATIMEAYGIGSTPYPSDGFLSSEPPSEWIYYNTTLGKFMVAHEGYYYRWTNDQKYNNPETDAPYTDRLYKIGSKYYYFEPNNNKPIEYKCDPQYASKEFQKVVFVHRSRLFNQDANIKEIEYAVEARYTVNHSAIYSTIEIGYDKKDYDSMNGRDEFNFNHTYSTGCSLSDKKLSLISKYRADCYGIEFAAQKRGQDTTDSNSDNDVFFVLCESAGHDVYPDRSDTIAGALSDAVFNGKFSPIHCLRANAGYIGMQADVLTLSFASSTGNSNIAINGERMSSNITLNTPLLTTGELEFQTGDLDTPPTDNLVSVEVRGIKYVGFIKEVEENYGREAAAKYKLLVKSMEL